MPPCESTDRTEPRWRPRRAGARGAGSGTFSLERAATRAPATAAAGAAHHRRHRCAARAAGRRDRPSAAARGQARPQRARRARRAQARPARRHARPGDAGAAEGRRRRASTEATGDPGLDTVLAEIELRVEVELAKVGMPLSRPGKRCLAAVPPASSHCRTAHFPCRADDRLRCCRPLGRAYISSPRAGGC